MSFWDKKDFKELQKKWYKKLEESGFKDIEMGPTQHMDTANIYDAEAVAIYFRKASQYLFDTEWRSIKEREIWAMHSEGFSDREIASVVRASRTAIRNTIEKHRANII